MQAENGLVFSFFRMKLRNLSQITGNDGLYLHRFHNGVGTDK